MPDDRHLAQFGVALRAVQILDSPASEEHRWVIAAAASALGVPTAALRLDVDVPGRLRAEISPQPLSLDPALLARVAASRPLPLIISDTHRDDELSVSYSVMDAPFIRFFAAFPLLGDEAGLGALLLCGPDPVEPTPDQLSIVDGLARTLAKLIEFRSVVTELDSARADLEMARSELADAVVQLRRRNADIEQFGHMASHDLRAPIRRIRLLHELLADEFDEIPDTAVPLFASITDTADRALALIDGMLAFAGIDRDLDQPGVVKLEDVVAAVLADHDAVLHAAGAAVHVGPLPDVHGHWPLLYQLFGNLVVNAATYRDPERQLRINIDLTDSVAGQHEIAVADTAVGIAPEFHQEIFKMLRRLHRNEDIPGAGIGLPMARRIAELHGGSLEVDSSRGVGSTFSVHLATAESAGG